MSVQRNSIRCEGVSHEVVCKAPFSPGATWLPCSEAQIAVTSLRGTVSDPSGAVVGGAEVTISQATSGFRATRKTAANGEYTFPQIAPGSYSISVSSAGFSNQVKTAELLVSQPATIDFILSMSTLQEVEVDAAADTLNTSDATLGNALNNATIEALPSEGRNVPDLFSLQPGVVYLGQQISTRYG